MTNPFQLTIAFAAALTGFAASRRPELLRSEEHQTVSHYLEWLQTTDVDDQAKIAAAEKPMIALLNRPKTLKPDRPDRGDSQEDDRDG